MISNPPIPVSSVGHISIAVPNLEVARLFYIQNFGCEVGDPIDVPEQGIKMAYVTFNNIKIELMEPINSLSPIAKFIEKNPSGGLHHICFTTKDAEGSLQQIKKKGVKVLGNGEVSTGHHGRDIFFMHPKNTLGTLIEIEQNGNKGAKF